MDSPPPITTRIGGLLKALLRYVEARGELLQLEAREAGSKSVLLVFALAVAIAAFVLAWLLALPALVWIIAAKGGWHWSAVSLSAAGVHLVVCLVALAVFRGRLRGLQIFEESLRQLQKDREWMGGADGTGGDS